MEILRYEVLVVNKETEEILKEFTSDSLDKIETIFDMEKDLINIYENIIGIQLLDNKTFKVIADYNMD